MRVEVRPLRGKIREIYLSKNPVNLSIFIDIFINSAAKKRLRAGRRNEFTPIPEYLKFIKRAEDLGFDPPLFTDTVSPSRFHLRDPLVVTAPAARAAERGAAEGRSPDPIIAKIALFS